MSETWLSRFGGTEWSGKGELWLDPDGNQVENYLCGLKIDADELNYTWLYEDETKEGKFTFVEGGAIWTDSWHQPEAVKCADVPYAWGLFTVAHSYEVPSSPAWGWQSKLSERPGGILVLQMTNVTPWGEEGRAVRMVFTRTR